MLNINKLNKVNFPRTTSLATGTNGTPLSVTFKAIQQLKEPQDIADFALEMVRAHSLEIPIEEAAINVNALISYALADFGKRDLVVLWENALPQAELMGGHLPNDHGTVVYNDKEDLGNQLGLFFDSRRKK